jgi:uncharacterized membrane protein YsdA (DUF1294 family)/cold shock CspA family protein
MRTKGKLSSWNDQKGFGFIDPVGGGKRVFVHIKAFASRDRRPEPGLIVTYTLSTDKQGRPCAVDASTSGSRSTRKAPRRSGTLSTVGAAVFLSVVGASVVTSKVPPAIFAIYLVVSLVTFAAYAMDKSAARKGAWRIQESTLHMLSLLGGWPGALVAQQKVRHKTSKRSFRTVFWFTVIVNIGAFVWVSTQGGEGALRALFAASL